MPRGRTKFRLRATVANTGSLAGDEVVQLYISDLEFSIARPTVELRGFERVHLAPGESRTVRFPLTAKELGFYNKELNYVVEPGRFRIAVGGNPDSLVETVLLVKGEEDRPGI
jgi:beta-glucosidase